MSTRTESSIGQSSTTTNKRTKPIRPSKLSRPGLRTYNDIVNSGAYNQPDYHPQPISLFEIDICSKEDFFISLETRSDQEKDRLANLMAYGIDPLKVTSKSISNSPTSPPPHEIDRFDECRIKLSSCV